jgi:hypothetical protein
MEDGGKNRSKGCVRNTQDLLAIVCREKTGSFIGPIERQAFVPRFLDATNLQRRVACANDRF